MDILEIKSKKEELEIKINQLLSEFEEETTLKVKDLELKIEVIKGYSGDVVQYINVNVKVEI